jgi:hypothetical protein
MLYAEAIERAALLADHVGRSVYVVEVLPGEYAVISGRPLAGHRQIYEVQPGHAAVEKLP